MSPPSLVPAGSRRAWELRRAHSLGAVVLATAFFFACKPERPSVVDDLGRAVQLRGAVRRVVTLAPNVTELVSFAGGEALLVATDDFSDYPASVRGLPRVGGMQPSLEAIVAQRPDLVVASTSGNHPSLAPSLQGAGIPLYVVRTERLSEIRGAMDRLRGVLGITSPADPVRGWQRALMAERRTRRKRPTVLFLVWPDPLTVAGRSTFIDDLIELAGGENAAAANTSGWPQYSLEAVISNPPDLILYPRGSVSETQLAAVFEGDRRWNLIPAVREKRYVGVDENHFTRPGPRVLGAARELNEILDSWESRSGRL